MKWATWIAEDGEQHLVVVEADSQAKACEQSGLVFETFHEATESELRAWDELRLGPLSEGDIGAAVRLIHKRLREIGSTRRRNRARGRRHDDYLNLRAVRKLTETAAKLETLDEDEA